MQNLDIQIIGDRIEFLGYHVGNLSEIIPCTIRNRFIDLLENSRPNKSYSVLPFDGLGKVR